MVEDHKSGGTQEIFLSEQQLDHLPQIVTVLTRNALISAQL